MANGFILRENAVKKWREKHRINISGFIEILRTFYYVMISERFDSLSASTSVSLLEDILYF